MTSTPPSSTRPSSGSSKPAISRSVVVLPEPDGPSSVKNSPLRDVQVDAVDGGDVAVALDELDETDIGSVPRLAAVSVSAGRCDARLQGRPPRARA